MLKSLLVGVALGFSLLTFDEELTIGVVLLDLEVRVVLSRASVLAEVLLLRVVLLAISVLLELGVDDVVSFGESGCGVDETLVFGWLPGSFSVIEAPC